MISVSLCAAPELVKVIVKVLASDTSMPAPVRSNPAVKLMVGVEPVLNSKPAGVFKTIVIPVPALISALEPSARVIGPKVVQAPDPPAAAVSAEIAEPPLAPVTAMVARAAGASASASKRASREPPGFINSIETTGFQPYIEFAAV